MRQPLFIEMVPSNLTIGSDWMNELAEMYCDIWRYDENFQEYRQCPQTKKYYSYEYVEEQGKTVCNCCNPAQSLVEAWDPNEVAEYIWGEMNSKGFSGFISITESGEIIGFGWAKLMPLAKVSQNWGSEVVAKLTAPTSEVLYFAEVAVKREYRSKDYGNRLVRLVIEKSQRDNPANLTSLLRTHGSSRAFTVFGNAGYRKFSDDTMYGDGRVLMSSTVGALTPFNLED